MKRIISLAAICLILILQVKSQKENRPSDYQKKYEQSMKRTEWMRDARFGMFIHFGVYAVPARGEWVKSTEKMTSQEYQKYVEQFNPQDFNAKEWAKIAKDAGMKYAVLTAKHHDGYCLFDSKLTDYKSTHYGNPDIVREFLNAFRDVGLKVGLYYSIIDWHHKDYPNVGNHPQRDNETYSKKDVNWNNYLDYMHGQVKELTTQYGKIDIMWFDFSFDEYSGEKWRARELVEMVRKNQPEIILNNRLEINPGTTEKGRKLGYGDFETPEQGIPEKGLTDVYGNPIPWETCLTLNNNWGYAANDHQWKSSEMIIHSLVECVSKNGNLLLNVGPDARGHIPQESKKILSEIGQWMKTNGESIYGCGAVEYYKPEWGRLTGKSNRVFAHWMHPHIGHINIPELSGKVEYVSLLHDGSEAYSTESWWGNEEESNFFININEPTYKSYILPDSINTVFKIRLK